MDTKPLYQYIFDLLDYADELAKLILSGGQDNNNYFMTLVYIEDILDKYGRGLVLDSAKEYVPQGVDPSGLLKIATQRMDALRKTIRIYAQQYDFDETLKARGESMYQDWHKLPKDHPNVQQLEL